MSMKSHICRPLYAVIGIIVVVLIIRIFVVPKSFGVQERGYMYGWYNKDNEKFWKDFKVKYMSSEYCKDCHSANYSSIMQTPHAIIQCENCHGPAIAHPENPAKLEVDKNRELCLRCHLYLPYPTSDRAKIRGIDPDKHNAGIECIMCHNPHKPSSARIAISFLLTEEHENITLPSVPSRQGRGGYEHSLSPGGRG